MCKCLRQGPRPYILYRSATIRQHPTVISVVVNRSALHAQLMIVFSIGLATVIIRAVIEHLALPTVLPGYCLFTVIDAFVHSGQMKSARPNCCKYIHRLINPPLIGSLNFNKHSCCWSRQHLACRRVLCGLITKAEKRKLETLTSKGKCSQFMTSHYQWRL